MISCRDIILELLLIRNDIPETEIVFNAIKNFNFFPLHSHMEGQYILILKKKKQTLQFHLCCHLDKLSQLWVKNGAKSNLLEG